MIFVNLHICKNKRLFCTFKVSIYGLLLHLCLLNSSMDNHIFYTQHFSYILYSAYPTQHHIVYITNENYSLFCEVFSTICKGAPLMHNHYYTTIISCYIIHTIIIQIHSSTPCNCIHFPIFTLYSYWLLALYSTIAYCLFAYCLE